MKFSYDPPKPHKGITVYLDGVLFDKMTIGQLDFFLSTLPPLAQVVRVYEEKE